MPCIGTTRRIGVSEHAAIGVIMTTTSVSLTDGVLRISGRFIDAGYPVSQAIQLGEAVIARFDVPTGVVMNNNIACYDNRGTLLWTIQPSPYGGTIDDPYVSVQLADDATIVAQTWNGVEYEVNADDGTVSTTGFKRF